MNGFTISGLIFLGDGIVSIVRFLKGTGGMYGYPPDIIILLAFGAFLIYLGKEGHRGWGRFFTRR